MLRRVLRLDLDSHVVRDGLRSRPVQLLVFALTHYPHDTSVSEAPFRAPVPGGTAPSAPPPPGRTHLATMGTAMHVIAPARFKEAVSPDAIAPPPPDARSSSEPIRGTALIFWDLKIPGKKKKLDAIDTDQITPAADCVSESLD